jgi:hypothetical protein
MARVKRREEGGRCTGSGQGARCECGRRDAKDGGANKDVGTKMGSGMADRGRRGGADVLMACGASGLGLGGRAWCCNGSRRACREGERDHVIVTGRRPAGLRRWSILAG